MFKPNRLLNYWINRNGQQLWIQGEKPTPTPTSSNPVVATTSPLTQFAKPEKAQAAIAEARGAFDLPTPYPTSPANPNIVRQYDTTSGAAGTIVDTSAPSRYTTSTVAPDRYAGIVAEQEAESQILAGGGVSEGEQEASRRFFNQLGETGISQDELMQLTGTTDAQRARAMIEGTGGLSPEQQLALNEQYEALRYEKAKAKEEGELMTEEERIRADVESMFAPQYTAARQAAEKTQQSALRLRGRAAMGSQSAEEQKELIEYERQIESSIAAEQRIQEQMLLAEARGASAEELDSLSAGLSNAKAARQKYQEELELRQAGLDEASIAKAEANNELFKLSLDALEAGYELNPETGEFTKLTDTSGGSANMDLSKEYGFLVGDNGQPILNSSGNIVELPKSGENFQKIEQENPFTGEKQVIGFYDPSTGKTTYYGGTADITGEGTSKNYVYRDENGSQCGEGANDNTTGTKDGQKIHFGNTYADKAKWIEDDITLDNAQAGNTLIIPMTVGGSLETGHVAIVTGVKGDTVYVDEFNRQGDEQLTSGSYSLDELNKYSQATGQKWGFANTQFKPEILTGGGKATDQFTPEEKEVMQAAADMGTDPKEALQLYKATGVMPTKKAVSGEAAKVSAFASTGVDQAKDFRKTIEKLPDNFAEAAIFLKTDSNIQFLIDQLADKVGRIRSGGAINKQEEDRFKRGLQFTWTDILFGEDKGYTPKELLDMKLQAAELELSLVAGGMDPTFAREQALSESGLPAQTIEQTTQTGQGLLFDLDTAKNKYGVSY